MTQRISLILLVILVILTSWALLKPGLFPIHDYVHGARIAQMHQALSDGHVPPRWSKDFGYGYGMPLFEFYGPLPFIVGSFFYSFFSLESSVKVIIFLPALLTVLGGFKLGEKLGGTWAGVVAAALISLAPYRAVNTFVRGAVSELWGMLFAVWLLVAIIGVFKKEKWSPIWIALTLAGLVMSHNLTVVMMFPIAFGLTLLLFISYILENGWKFTELKPMVMRLVGGSLLGAGLASFYLIPAFIEKEFTQVESRILGGYFDYSQHFVYIRQFIKSTWSYGGSNWGPDDGISFFLGFPQIVLIALTAIVILLWFVSAKLHILQNIVATFIQAQTSWSKILLLIGISGLLGISLFMSLGHSAVIWQQIELLKYLQFPWRWLTMAVICIGMMSAVLVSVLREGWQKVVVALAVALSLLHVNYFQPSSYLENSEDLYYADPDLIQSEMSNILPDYLPAGFTAYSPIAGSRDRFQSDIQVQVEVISDRTHEYLVTTINTYKPQTMTFAIAQYPGWIAEIDGLATPLKTSDTGLLQVDVPVGKHVIGLRFGETPLRQTANTITAISICILLGIIIWYEQKRVSTHPA